MELGDAQNLISGAFEKTRSDHIAPLINWLDAQISKFRYSGSLPPPIQSVLTPKINHGQRFVCGCGRSFAAELSIRETTHVETSSPPATPMLSMKTDLKHHQHSQEPIAKRSKILMTDPSISMTPIASTSVNRLNTSSIITSWQANNVKTYADSPELMTGGDSNRGESDIDLSSDESGCLNDMDSVLSSDKTAASNFIYSTGLWPTSLSPPTNGCLSYSTEDHHQEQMITLKPVNSEPLSPTLAHGHDVDSDRTVTVIHRRPMLIAVNDPDASSPTGLTRFRCTQCHEIFDSVLHGQEHANNGMCLADSTVNVLDNSDSHLSPSTSSLFDPLQENIEEVLNVRVDSKAACPICSKVFSSVHTMIRHKTSIHDRQVRYGCNICGRFFFRKDKLTSHMVYHQDYDTYVCCYCRLGCKSRMLMRQHLKRDHAIGSEETNLNDILARCQVKKCHNLETNMSVAYGADRQTTSVRRNLNPVSTDNDVKQTVSN